MSVGSITGLGGSFRRSAHHANDQRMDEIAIRLATPTIADGGRRQRQKSHQQKFREGKNFLESKLDLSRATVAGARHRGHSC
jgi:hypothetical protein